jgi:hypothetical protein
MVDVVQPGLNHLFKFGKAIQEFEPGGVTNISDYP